MILSPPRRSLSTLACCGLLITMKALAIAGPQTPDMVTSEAPLKSPRTMHRLTTPAGPLSYTAWFEETVLAGPNHTPVASVSATSYVRSGVKDASKRPVIVAFNGGPGASSSPLHFNAFGPKRTERDASGARHLVDNDLNLLDVADLLFVDPVGTGFSRERAGAPSGVYFAPKEDAQAVLALIRQWQRDNHREASPLYIAGESYGGFRIAMMMQGLKDLPLSGLILISPGLDLSGSSGGDHGNDLPYILELPSMAAAAWYHERVPRSGREVGAFFDEAAQFAQTDYALGLIQGAALAPEARHRLAQRMAGFLGLSVESIERANLRIDSQYFLEHLAGEDKIVGRVDTRIAADKPKQQVNADRPAAANDPSLGMGASNVIKSQMAKDYFAKELQVTTERDYLALSLDVNFRWRWDELIYDPDPKEPTFYVNPTGYIAEVMKEQPRLRILLIGGYYDLAVPLLAPRYALSHAGVAMDRVTVKAFAGPHSTFEGIENLRQGSAAVRAFVRD